VSPDLPQLDNALLKIEVKAADLNNLYLNLEIMVNKMEMIN
jgi:hypothetical protein